jgi:hypothetical protein
MKEEVYTFHIGSDLTVARFVLWAYYNSYPEHINLDTPVRTKMPTSRWSSLEDYLAQSPRPRLSSPTSAINIAANRELIAYGQEQPIFYTLAQKEYIADNFPFLVHLRMYVFATQHGLRLLQDTAFSMAKSCCNNPQKLAMRVDRKDLICEAIGNQAIFIHFQDQMMRFIEHVMKLHTVPA